MKNILVISTLLLFAATASAEEVNFCSSSQKFQKAQGDDGTLEKWCEVDGKKDGKYERTFPGGIQIYIRSNYKEDTLDGAFEQYHGNGKVSAQGDFEKGFMVGTWKRFWENGELKDEGQWKEGVPAGNWQHSFETGDIRAKGQYACGKKTGDWDLKFSQSGQFERAKFLSGCEETLTRTESRWWSQFEVGFAALFQSFRNDFTNDRENASTMTISPAWTPRIFTWNNFKLFGVLAFIPINEDGGQGGESGMIPLIAAKLRAVYRSGNWYGGLSLGGTFGDDVYGDLNGGELIVGRDMNSKWLHTLSVSFSHFDNRGREFKCDPFDSFCGPDDNKKEMELEALTVAAGWKF